MPVYNERWTLEEIVRRVLSSPVSVEIELVVVDDASSDGSWELLQELAAADPRIRAVRHVRNRGKGAAIRTAIEHMTGQVAVIQDADLEYDPHELPILLAPILEGKADAVFGSRFTGHTRRVLFFWHALMNKALTLLSNMLNNLNLTDMETCYKMVRAEVLKNLRLTSNTFTLEPELTCRLAQCGARIYEVPISYFGRTYQEGKKIRARDGLKAVAKMLWCKFLAPRFTDNPGFYTLAATARANKYNQWILDQVRPFLGARLLEAGSGTGNLSGLLVNRPRLLLADNDPMYVGLLEKRFARRPNIRVDQADLTRGEAYRHWKDERLDTILCSNVLEHLPDDVEVLERFQATLAPGGHCVLVVPAGRWLYGELDRQLGHYRRYSRRELCEKLALAGFEVVFTRQFSRLGSLGWGLFGRFLGRKHLSPWQMSWYDRLLPLVKLLDRILPVPGMSLIAVGRKPATADQRAAA